MKTTKSVIVVLFVLLTAQIASAYYCPSTGRWLSRDPVGELGFQALQMASQPSIKPRFLPSSDRWIVRGPIAEAKFNMASKASRPGGPNLYSIVDNNCIGHYDILGLKKGGNGISVTFIRCSPALSQSDEHKILDGLNDGAATLDQVIDGSKSLPKDLTLDMAKCMRSKLNGLGFGCVSCGPACWGGGGGLSLPGTSTVFICPKNFSGDSYPNDEMASTALHEIVHTCGKIGHSSPDNPYDWATFLSL